MVLALALIVLSGVATCNGQDLISLTFHMNGVRGSANLTQAGSQLMVNLTLSESLGDTRLEIHPLWVDYDVSDKCSDIQLGPAISMWTINDVFIGNSSYVVIQNVSSLASVGGHSMVLRGSNKVICTSIESELPGDTAVAMFQDSVLGTVFFRQPLSWTPYTRILSDLYSPTGTFSGTWSIPASATNCSNLAPTSQLPEYNPNSVSNAGCSESAPENCAVGRLYGKLGNITVSRNKGDSRLGFTDRNLQQLRSIDGKVLLVTAPDGSRACAVIRLFSERKAWAKFSHAGITGTVSFSQKSPFDSTTTSVALKLAVAGAKGYHVHMWPTPTRIVPDQDLCGALVVAGHFDPYNKNASDTSNYPAQSASTNDMYEVGDLSSKYVSLAMLSNLNQDFKDWNLPLFGAHSIIGRSVVIHRNDSSSSRWVCSNIVEKVTTMSAIAVFKHPVIGHVKLMQAEGQIETSISVQLDYNDGRPGTKNHTWGVHVKSMTGNQPECVCPNNTYSPQTMWQSMSQDNYVAYCSQNSPLGCKFGDLSGKLGRLNIRNSQPGVKETSTKHFFTDQTLPLSGPNSVIGMSIVILDEAGSSVMASATIQKLHDPHLEASLNGNGVSGKITFKQVAGFGGEATQVTNELTGLREDYRLVINDLPPANTNDCSDLGNVYNPLSVLSNTTAPSTDDQFPVGDLARFGRNASWEDLNLPLMGLASIRMRSLAVVDGSNKTVACGSIQPVLPSDGSLSVHAVSTFTDAITGTIHLFQDVFVDGTMSDTSILMNLMYAGGGRKSFRHNWHTHLSPVQFSSSPPCASTGLHFDPYMAKRNMNYTTECRPSDPFHCELGDQASKLATYDIGGGRKLFNDVDLPLLGSLSVQGRSFVVHKEEKGDERLACADIIPVTSDAVPVEIKSTTSLNRTDMARVYAAAINANPSDVVVEFLSETQGLSKFHVHFIGFNRLTLKDSFTNIIKGNNKDMLGPYIPSVNNIAANTIFSTMLLLFALAVATEKCV